MKSTLLAIYAVTARFHEPNTVHWYEYQLDQHFFTPAVCEHYRPRLVAEWLHDPHVPFTKAELASSRCGPWVPDPTTGTDL